MNSAEINRCRSGMILLAGDLNAKSMDWGSPVSNARGVLLSEWCAENDLLILNRGTAYTCVRHNGGSVVDLTLGSPGLARRVRDWVVDESAETFSDHRYIRMCLSFGGSVRTPSEGNKAKEPLK